MIAKRLRAAALESIVGLPGLPVVARGALLRLCGVDVGTGTTLRARCVFTSDRVSFGERCWINFAVTFGATTQAITVGDRVHIGHNVVIATATHEFGGPEERCGPRVDRPVRIGSGCWIGAGATILPGATIGPGCVVAGGAVVVGDCAPNGLYGGVPARRIRDLDGDPR